MDGYEEESVRELAEADDRAAAEQLQAQMLAELAEEDERSRELAVNMAAAEKRDVQQESELDQGIRLSMEFASLSPPHAQVADAFPTAPRQPPQQQFSAARPSSASIICTTFGASKLSPSAGAVSMKVCENCEKTTATIQCRACAVDEQILCAECDLLVHKIRARRDHQRGPYTLSMTAASFRDDTTCMNCDTEVATVFCPQCSPHANLLCAECDAAVHVTKSARGHSRSPVKSRPSAKILLCENCDDHERGAVKSPATIRCANCETSLLCGVCDASIHNVKAFRGHIRSVVVSAANIQGNNDDDDEKHYDSKLPARTVLQHSQGHNRQQDAHFRLDLREAQRIYQQQLDEQQRDRQRRAREQQESDIYVARLVEEERLETARRAARIAADEAEAHRQQALLGVQVVPFDCTICFERKQPDRGDAAVRLDACDHPLCVECFTGLVQGKIESKTAAKCPHDGCASPVTARDVHNALGANLASAYAEIEQRELMLRLGPSLYKCATPDCAEAVLVDEALRDAKARYTCQSCNKVWCVCCKLVWHDGSTCEAHQRWRAENGVAEETTMRLVQALNYRKCPVCGAIVEKTSGCNHISCRCGAHFDYATGARMNM